MERIETIDRIKSGAIRIEDGRLIGMGVGSNESIDIEALHSLLTYMGKDGVVETISDTISSVALIQAKASLCDESENDELKKFVNEELRPYLRDIEVFCLNMILKTFNK